MIGLLEIFCGWATAMTGALLVAAAVSAVPRRWRESARERLIIVCLLVTTAAIATAGVLLFLEGIGRLVCVDC